MISTAGAAQSPGVFRLIPPDMTHSLSKNASPANLS
ncbi:hypothetical protein HCH_02444 [Hahella chejuensis KCTC 2396]|uniref:Uncharacterized protein n=1 Tax=Hahella chejuensis (strain KCTC 2396) TaxID=349521 RepID=Q2SJC3_HAHCH|nr:hypothetical protein HCH_02444 [Hahella chejuensis KCTC 2396]